jgi:hypothetical protein
MGQEDARKPRYTQLKTSSFQGKNSAGELCKLVGGELYYTKGMPECVDDCQILELKSRHPFLLVVPVFAHLTMKLVIARAPQQYAEILLRLQKGSRPTRKEIEADQQTKKKEIEADQQKGKRRIYRLLPRW